MAMTKREAKEKLEPLCAQVNECLKVLGHPAELLILAKPDKSDPLNHTVFVAMKASHFVPDDE